LVCRFDDFTRWTFAGKPGTKLAVVLFADLQQMNLTYIWVALGGALGSVARYWLNGVVSTRYGETFPLGTIVVNVSGSFVIGVLGALTLPEGRMSAGTRTLTTQLLMIGVCGGFTTFSSFTLQTLNLVREREWLHAGGNVLLSVILCLVATWLGYLLGSVINPTRGN